MAEMNGGGGETVVALAFTGSRRSKLLLKWAVDKFLPEGNVTFRLLHVYPKITSVPTPMGSWLPITQIRDDVAASYRQEIEWKKKKAFLLFIEALKSKKIKSDVVMLEADDIPMAITLDVAKHSVRHLVVGLSSNSIFSRKNLTLRKMMGENLSSAISENAPSFCSVYVIADGKLQHMRPADSEPTEINVDEMSGMPMLSTDSSSSSSALTLGRILKGSPSSPRYPGSVSTTQNREPDQKSGHYGSYSNTNTATNATNPRVAHQNSSSSDSWVSDRTSPGGSLVGTPPAGSFLGTTPPSGSFVSTPPKGSYVGTPPGSFLGTPRRSSPMGTPPYGPQAGSINPPSISLVEPHGRGSSVSVASQQQTPAGSPRGETSSQASELDKLRMELRHLEQMYELAQKSDINEKFTFPLDQLTDLSKQRVEEAIKLKEQKAKELANIQQNKPKPAETEASNLRENAQKNTPQKKEETKATKQEKENEDKLNQLITGSISQYQKFTWGEIVQATSSFSEEFKIGMGAFGTVYRCKLHHTTVAVKVLHSKDSATNKQFLQELEILSSIRHPHLLLLLGAVPEQSCLVYEYMDNGSLDDRLFRKNETPPLPWYDRFRICWEVASALAFLHSTKPRPIIHRDLKPANILLDHNLVSKIGDAGLGTMINVEPTNKSLKTLYKETSPVGTLCYIDPEYQRTGRVSTKSDTYALGVVILQLLTAKPAVGIAYLVEDAIDEGTLMEVLDPKAGQWPPESLEMALLGLQCAELRGRDRPDLTEKVLPALERLKEIADNARDTASSASNGPPAHFICPIRKDVMEDPYVAADGYTYDRKAIEEWLTENNTSPTTYKPLPHKFIMPNTTLLEAIKQWRSKTPVK